MKQYVMLEDKSIVDTSKSDKYKIHENTLWHNSMLVDNIVIQSDNLLDLLEMGDMIEIKDETEDLDFDYIPIITEFDVKLGKAMKSPFSFAVAIWKRNGDVMRRYEV